MDSNYILGANGELYHWGTKGMKWGVRRYQNKDGSLTPAGKKRYAAEEAKLKAREKEIKGREKAAAKKAKLDSKKAELDAREAALKGGKSKTNTKSKSDSDASKPKSIKDMSDDELRNLTTRMTLEKNFYEAQSNLAKAIPKKSTVYDKLKDSYLDDIVKSVIIEPGKKYVNGIVDKKLSSEGKDILSKLEREWKEADYRKKIAEAERDAKKAKNPEPDKLNYDNEKKRLEYEDALAKVGTNRKNREIERMKAEQAYAKQKEEYEAWLEQERKKRQEQGGS